MRHWESASVCENNIEAPERHRFAHLFANLPLSCLPRVMEWEVPGKKREELIENSHDLVIM